MLRIILQVCLFTNVHEINQQYKQKPKIIFDLFKLFVTCSSLRILKHRLNPFFIAISPESLNCFKTLSKIPTFTLSIKINGQFHLKMLSCKFYLLKILKDVWHMVLQSARKLNQNIF